MKFILKMNICCLISIFLLLPSQAYPEESGDRSLKAHEVEQLVENILTKNPDLIFDVIANNPEKFFSVVTEAQERSSSIQRENEKEEFKNYIDTQVAESVGAELDPVRAVRGNTKAPISIIKFSDFQCPYCKQSKSVVDELFLEYEDKINYSYRHLIINETSYLPAQYFEALAIQNELAAWKFHDLLFEYSDWVYEKNEEVLELFLTALDGVDRQLFDQDLNSEELLLTIESDEYLAEEYGFDGTPSFLINGVSIAGHHEIEDLRYIIDSLLAKFENQE